MVSHEQVNWLVVWSELVTMIGPPATPAGSMLPVICINRLGWVGPSTEQK